VLIQSRITPVRGKLNSPDIRFSRSIYNFNWNKITHLYYHDRVIA